MIKVIAFDLDDTLVDTSGVLVPQALQNVHKVLLQHGSKLSFDEFNRRRLGLTHDLSHKEIFSVFVKELALQPSTEDAVIQKCVGFFYEPEVPAQLPLLTGAVEILEYLAKKYPLYLVTSGSLTGQKKKIDASHLKNYFKKILIIPSPDHTDKKAAFVEIIEQEGIVSKELLSVGNRLSNEIRYAKEIGAQTCYLQYGEHAHETPQHAFEHPDFKIYSLKDLLAACPL